MRVLQLGKFYPIQGGVEKVMLDLVDGLSAQGICCDMLCANTHIGEATKIIQYNKFAQIFCVKAWGKKFATMLSWQMIKILRQIGSNYDIIHVHHPDPMAALALLLSGYEGKVVLHWPSDILKQKVLLRFFMPLQNWLLNRADIVIGTTPVYVAQSPHLMNFQDKCSYLPIGINPVLPDSKQVLKIKNRYPGKKIIFSLGRLVEYKGYKFLVEAAKYLPDDYIILIGGSGPLKASLQSQIEHESLQDKVLLLGRISDEDLSSYYGACDLYCLPSIMKTEAFAIVQIEAMSCGKPIVATKIPESGVSWVNADGESGFNVPVKDSKALADAIARILCDQKIYQRLSQGAKTRFNHLFIKEKMIETCIGIYNKLLSEREDDNSILCSLK